MSEKNFLEKHAEIRRVVLRVIIVGIVANVVLVAAKLTFGLIFGNLSVLSDAVHSASDLITSLFVVVAVFISSPKRDKKHNYGHEKIEPLMVLFFALVLAGIAALFVWQGIEGLVSPTTAEFNWFLVSVTVLSIVVKEALFWYGMHHAKKTKSEILKADAWHSRSDSLASVAVLIGLVCALFMDTNIVESIAVLIVSLFIFKAAWEVFKPSVDQLIDRAADKRDVDAIIAIAEEIDGVIRVDDIRTRIFGNSILVDLEILVDGALTVTAGHDIAQEVHDVLEGTAELRIKHCNVHVNPCGG
ncbi:MAG: cation diffusion facilitator family transporter [Firmicutes bacterium]|nr:cation diffusion facilitator family transporter [Bacillota bacterium]